MKSIYKINNINFIMFISWKNKVLWIKIKIWLAFCFFCFGLFKIYFWWFIFFQFPWLGVCDFELPHFLHLFLRKTRPGRLVDFLCRFDFALAHTILRPKIRVVNLVCTWSPWNLFFLWQPLNCLPANGMWLLLKSMVCCGFSCGMAPNLGYLNPFSTSAPKILHSIFVIYFGNLAR